MAKFTVKVTAMVPTFLEVDVELEAADQRAAESKVREMYDNDELAFDDGEPDYDEAKIVSIDFYGNQ